MEANLYHIPFVGLSIGLHEFEYQIDETFFKNYEYSPIKNGDITVEIEFEKQETMLVLDFYIAGTTNAICDRCLEEFNLEIDGHNKLIVKFGEQATEESDEIVVIPRGVSELDVSQYIYEFITLLLPYKVAHPDDDDGHPTCNSEILKKLDELQAKSSTEQTTTDPRWAALKSLYNNNDN